MQAVTIDQVKALAGEDDFVRLNQDQIVNEDDLVTYPALEQAEQTAIEHVRSVLGHRYDLVTAFAAVPVNPMLTRIIIDLLLFELYTQVMPTNIPQSRGVRYDNARADLAKWANGTYLCPLPQIIGRDEASTNVYAWGDAYNHLRKDGGEYKPNFRWSI